MRSLLFFFLIYAAIYCYFTLGVNLGYLFLIGAFLVFGYSMFRIALQ